MRNALYFFIPFILTLPFQSFGAIAFDQYTTNDQSTAVTTVSWTFTPVGTPSAIFLQVDQGNVVTAASYGGTDIFANLVHGNLAYVWYLASPPAGAQTVSFSFSPSTSRALSSVMSLTGTATTNGTLVGQSVTNSSTSNAPQAALSLNAFATSLVISNLFFDTNPVLTPPNGWTQRGSTAHEVTSNDSIAQATLAATSSPTGLTWTSNISGTWSILAIEVLAPASAAAGPSYYEDWFNMMHQ